jgi:HEPN domain-containing protein
MKPDPKEEAQRWLLQANNDLESARFTMGGGFHAQACFMAQQSAEKGLKALVYRQGARYARGHSIRGLLEGLLEPYPQLEQYREMASRLDQYYITPRYPNALPEGGLAPFQVFTQGQAREALDGADGILREVRQLLES